MYRKTFKTNFHRKRQQKYSKKVMSGLNQFLHKNGFQEKDSAKMGTQICLTPLARENERVLWELPLWMFQSPCSVKTAAGKVHRRPGPASGLAESAQGLDGREKRNRESNSITGAKPIGREVTNRKTDFSNSCWLEVSSLAREEGQNGWETLNEKIKLLKRAHPVWDRSPY